MKLSSKPISSPGRTDKFPPPLMRFLRTNVGSKSKGRSRSKSNSRTMFLRKKNTNIETTQEPSSPKVTCMGQVRVKRSSKSKQPNTTTTTRAAASDGAPARCPCLWIKKNAFSIKTCKCRCKPFWPKWGFLFCVGRFRRKSNKMKEASTKTELETEHVDKEQDKSEYEKRAMNGDDFSSFASNSSTPPINALLLTKCRSAPYRSSSLASRFWGSPLRNEEETEEKQGNENENRGSSYSENELPHLERNSVSEEESKRVSENEEKLVFFKELEDSLVRDRVGSMNKTEKVEGLKKRENGEGDYEAPCPIVLTRCKSEPARTGFKLILR
ncbi:hypothetical protein TanjilG_06243 [Lupinus angustifolius]|uniref:Uncharacterized protein n=1 Tax=Lupinus angustifolius TaxID=3871 RepID=A0A394DE77_LUPAN|nr:PREDICTED: uncharacterized protein LOC109340152 [Lupinus angustifolius]OIW21550.1 hypothetical protein TanjilG_06243 [Lupinus angustifolius]